MTSLTERGINHRTRLLPLGQATSTAAMLRGNGRFEAVELRESSRAKGERRHFVAYRSASALRKAELEDRFQAVQAERATLQAEDYGFALHESGAFYRCLNLKSGDEYQVTEESCSCPHFRERLAFLKLACKHVILLRRALAGE